MTHRSSTLRIAFAASLATASGLTSAPAPAVAPTASAPALAYPDLSPEENARIAWWVGARYGMFIHWGVASLKGVELSWARGGSKPLDISKHPAGYVEDPVYDHLYKQFNPVDFNPREWVRIAQAAGMKYMVLTVIELTLEAPSTGLIQGPSLRSLFFSHRVFSLSFCSDWLLM